MLHRIEGRGFRKQPAGIDHTRFRLLAALAGARHIDNLHKGGGLLALERLGFFAAPQHAGKPPEGKTLAGLEGKFRRGAQPFVERPQNGNAHIPI